MGCNAEEAFSVAKLLVLLVLALALAAFSYSLGYATGAMKTDERLGRTMEIKFLQSSSPSEGRDEAHLDERPAAGKEFPPAPYHGENLKEEAKVERD